MADAVRRVAIIANPVAGGGRPYGRIRRLVRRWPYPNWRVELLPTRGPEHAGEIARELLLDPPHLVAVCGGDGTMNEVAARVPAPPFPIALLPAGTANVLARDLGLPLDPLRALELALSGAVRQLDLGLVEGRTRHPFLLMAGAGLDAYVVYRVKPGLKRRIGRFAFYVAALQALLAYDFPELQVSVDGETVAATSCLAANSRAYGGGLVFTPEADMTDGLLDLFLVHSRRRVEYMRLLISAWRGRPPRFPWVSRRRVPAAEIRGGRGVWVHVDGELIGTLPLHLSVLPGSFPVVAPGAGRRHEAVNQCRAG